MLISECGYSNLLVALWNPQVVFGLAWSLFLCVFISMVFFLPQCKHLQGGVRLIGVNGFLSAWSSDTPLILSADWLQLPQLL